MAYPAKTERLLAALDVEHPAMDRSQRLPKGGGSSGESEEDEKDDDDEEEENEEGESGILVVSTNQTKFSDLTD